MATECEGRKSRNYFLWILTLSEWFMLLRFKFNPASMFPDWIYFCSFLAAHFITVVCPHIASGIIRLNEKKQGNKTIAPHQRKKKNPTLSYSLHIHFNTSVKRKVGSGPSMKRSMETIINITELWRSQSISSRPSNGPCNNDLRLVTCACACMLAFYWPCFHRRWFAPGCGAWPRSAVATWAALAHGVSLPLPRAVAVTESESVREKVMG